MRLIGQQSCILRKNRQTVRGLCFAVSGILVMSSASLQAATVSATASQVRGSGALAAAGRPLLLPVQAAPDEFSAADVMGQPGIPISLAIYAGRDDSTGDLFALSGVPPEVQLSAGGRRNGLWIVRQKDIASLSLIAPHGFTGKFQIAVTRAPAPPRPERTVNFTVNVFDERLETRAAAIPTSASVDRMPPPLTQTPAYNASPDEKMLFERADTQLRKGDVAGARAIFEVLAAKGNPAAAFALGSTYDPIYLEKLFIAGVEGDAKKALEWYRKADKMGNAEAQARLNSLGQR